MGDHVVDVVGRIPLLLDMLLLPLRSECHANSNTIHSVNDVEINGDEITLQYSFSSINLDGQKAPKRINVLPDGIIHGTVQDTEYVSATPRR